MSAVPKLDFARHRASTSADFPVPSEIPIDLFQGQAVRSQRQSSATLQAVPTASLRSRVRRLPGPRPTPMWLRALLVVQQGSAIASWTLIGSVLVLYGLTVYAQQSWSQVYRKLDHLQQNEQQIVAANEMLKDYVAEQASGAGSTLVPAKPPSNIFLKRAPQRSVPESIAAEGADALSTADLPKPLGY